MGIDEDYMTWRDEIGRMLDEKLVDAEQDFRRSMSKNADDGPAYWKARQAVDLAQMRRDCYADGRAYGSGSGGSGDYSVPSGCDNPSKPPAGAVDYSNKWRLKRY